MRNDHDLENSTLLIITFLFLFLIIGSFGYCFYQIFKPGKIDKDVKEIIIELKRNPPPSIYPIEPVTEEEFKLFQKQNGLE